MKSMTAFARKELRQKTGNFSWEVRSVNNRYLDISFRLPELFRDLEPVLRDHANRHLRRGKVDCSLKYQPGSDSLINLSVNDLLVSQLVNASKKVSKKFPKNQTVIDLIDLFRYPGVIETSEKIPTELQSIAVTLFDKTLIALNQSRAQEGKSIKRFLDQRLKKIQENIKKIQQLMPRIIDEYRSKLIARCQELSLELDFTRVEQEIALIAQKLDIHEELDRLRSHLEEVRRVIPLEESCGRRLDFLMQELNREANTTASKSVNKTITHLAVELKVLIEEMREQIQNIE